MCDRFWENPPKHGILWLFSTSRRLHGALGWRPPNLEAAAQAVFTLQLSIIFVPFIMADFKKTLRERVAKARESVLYSVNYCHLTMLTM